MDSLGPEVARLVVEPESPPSVFDLPKVFRLIQQLLHSSIWIAGILANHAAAVCCKANEGNQPENQFTEHNRLRAHIIPRPADACRSCSPTGTTSDLGYIVIIGTTQFILETEIVFLIDIFGRTGKKAGRQET